MDIATASTPPMDEVCDEDQRFSIFFGPQAVAPCASLESVGSLALNSRKSSSSWSNILLPFVFSCK